MNAGPGFKIQWAEDINESLTQKQKVSRVLRVVTEKPCFHIDAEKNQKARTKQTQSEFNLSFPCQWNYALLNQLAI